MKHHAEKICIAAIILHVVFALVCFAVSVLSSSSAAYAAAWLFLFGIFFWFLTYIHMWVTRSVEDEEREESEFERRRGAKDTGKLFEERKEEIGGPVAKMRAEIQAIIEEAQAEARSAALEETEPPVEV